MGREPTGNETGASWPQRVLDSIWVLALAAILYWMLSYVVWGIVDVLTVPGG